MIYRTYLDKVNTIIKGSKLNSGINPVCNLTYGGQYNTVSRVLVYFDHTNIKKMIEDKIFADTSKLKHYLKLTNAGSIDFTDVSPCRINDVSDNLMVRAASYDLIFFFIPQEWDGGKGFNMVDGNFSKNFLLKYNTKTYENGSNLLSEDGCNWYQPKNGKLWKEEGVYTNETLSAEYENFGSDSGSTIIFARQHFDVGNENINVDITDIVNKYINGELENYGIGIAYSPMLEESTTNIEEYSGFFTHKTPSFFEPYVESVYDDHISDDRGNFTLKKHNRLYLYCNIGGVATNLDELPTCTINDEQYNVVQFSKGIYYAEVYGDENKFPNHTMQYDIWSNIKYQGVTFDDVEMDFVVYGVQSFFNFGNTLSENKHFTPQVYGIRQEENIQRGDLRKINVIARENYSKNRANVVDNMTYRVYIKDGEREFDVLYGDVDKTVKENFFLIDTTILIPQRYYVDITFHYNMEEIMHREILTFNIVNNLNNKYS